MATAKKVKPIKQDSLEDVEKYVTETLYRLLTDEFNLPEVRNKEQESLEKYVVRMVCLSGDNGGIRFSLDVGGSQYLEAVLQKNWKLVDFQKDIKGSVKEFFNELEDLVNSGAPSPTLKLDIYSQFVKRDWVALSNRAVEFMKLTADLDVRNFSFQGKFENADDFFDSYFSTGKWKISHKDEKAEFFLKQWRTYETIAPLDIGRSDLDKMYNFFREVREQVKDKEIEKQFLKLFSNKTTKVDVEFNKRLCIKLIDLIDVDSISNETLKGFVKENQLKVTVDNENLSQPVDFKGYETFSFNQKAFVGFKLTTEREVKVGLDYSFKDDLFKTMLDLVTDKGARDYTGVTGVSPFKLPNKQSGYFLEVNENYTAEKFEKALGEASAMIQEESIKDPVSFNSTLRKFQNKEYREMFLMRVNKLLISEKINTVIEAKDDFDDTEMSRGSSFKL